MAVQPKVESISQTTLQAFNNQVNQVAGSVFDSSGQVIVSAVEKIAAIAKSTFEHHVHTHVRTIAGTQVIVEELAWNADLFGRMGMRLTIVCSPKDKLNGITHETSAKDASTARRSLMKVLDAKARMLLIPDKIAQAQPVKDHKHHHHHHHHHHHCVIS